MDRRRRKRKSPLRRVKKILLMPFYVFANTLIGLKDVLDQTLLFLGITKGVRRRRNKDFERAGRESFPRIHEVDATAAAKLQKVHLERASESLNAGLRERRLLAGRGAAAK